MTEGAAASSRRIALISPIRNEERTIAKTIAAMEKQTLSPAIWVLVDDGSTDGTGAILADAEKRIPWVKVVQRADRGYRKLGGGVIDAFYSGLDAVEVEYDFIGKMDVDLDFSATYLEKIMTYFEANPQLAAASGKVFRPEGDGLVEEFMIDEMVAGQFKLYRRHCFEAIEGFVREVMWDGIDFHKTRLAGFETASINDDELKIIHLRLMGSSDRSIYRGRLRWGKGQWFMGSCFPYVLASGIFRMREKPYIIGGLLIILGYLIAALRGQSRFPDLDFRRGLRRWQYERLAGLIKGQGPR